MRVSVLLRDVQFSSNVRTAHVAAEALESALVSESRGACGSGTQRWELVVLSVAIKSNPVFAHVACIFFCSMLLG